MITSSDEKINQIRIYSGEKYETVNELEAGRICAVTGLSDTYPGQCLGVEQGGYEPVFRTSSYLSDDPSRTDKLRLLCYRNFDN